MTKPEVLPKYDCAVKLQRSDYDQAVRYLGQACMLTERDAAAQTRGVREILTSAVSRLSAQVEYTGDLKAEITGLREAASRVPVPAARTEVLKAIAVLRDRAAPH